MAKYEKIALLFPGQGAQYAGMGKDFVQNYSAARMTYEEADEILGRHLSKIILNGDDSTLTQTVNSQTGIFVTSTAILRVFKEICDIQPFLCAGLSLGEYTALLSNESLDFQNTLRLVQHRGQFMNDACEKYQGAMAVILGLSGEDVEQLVKEVNCPRDLWVANFNCPGQVVISGTVKGIQAGTEAAKARGAKRVLPLSVQGAFHSGLMQEAQERLTPYIQEASIKKGLSSLVMNVPGTFVDNVEDIRSNLIKQVTHSVRWEQGIREMEKADVDLFIEFGPGKTLSGMNKRIGVKCPTFSIEKIEDLEILAKELR